MESFFVSYGYIFYEQFCGCSLRSLVGLLYLHRLGHGKLSPGEG